MDRRRLVGVVLVLVAGASFASGSIFATLSYRAGLDWLGLVGWRFVIGASLAWAWVAVSARRRGAARRMSRRQVALTLGLGAIYAGNAGAYYAGIEVVPAALAGVLVYIYPVFVALLSLRFATRLSGRRPYAALGLAVLGVVLALGGAPVASDIPPGGIVLIVVAALIYAVWIILSARLSGERRDRLGSETMEQAPAARDAAVTTAAMMTGTAIVFAAVAALAGRPLDPRTVPGEAWPHLLGVGMVASFLAIQTLYAGARRIGAAQAALVSTMEPIYIVVLSFLILDQRLAPLQLVGAACVFIAVIVAQTSPRPRGAPEPAQPLDAEVEG